MAEHILVNCITNSHYKHIVVKFLNSFGDGKFSSREGELQKAPPAF